MTPGKENRRSARVAVSRGLWVAWQVEADGTRHVSRVRDLSAGGVFIQTTLGIAIGQELELLFALPEGETRVTGIVRYADGSSGIGVEFTTMGSGDRLRVDQLLRRLKPK
jgi:Tfp pilus assembly protein PilZ